MSSGRGLIRGFLAGVAVALLFAGAAGYFIYRKVETAISPETVRETAEETLARIMGGAVQVQSGEISLPNILTLSGVTLSDSNGEMLSFERVQLIAEGGVQGIQEGRFAQVVVTQPQITLRRQNGAWNLVDFFKPLLTKKPSEAVEEKNPPPITLIRIVGLDFKTELEEGALYSGFQAEEATLSRKDLDSPWAVYARKGVIRMNPTANEWPLLETYSAVAALVAPASGPPPPAPSDRPPFQSPDWLGDVILDDFELEIIHPNQHLRISGLSMKADEMLEMIRLQTGSLEKKKPSPRA